MRFAVVLLSLFATEVVGQTAACPVQGDKIHWIADWCMSTLETDDEIAAGDCINEELKKRFGSDCAAKQHYKRRMCELAAKRDRLRGGVSSCMADRTFMGSTVRNGGVGGR